MNRSYSSFYRTVCDAFCRTDRTTQNRNVPARLLALALMCSSLVLLQSCKSPSSSQGGVPKPQIPGAPSTSVPSIPQGSPPGGAPNSGSPPPGGSSSSIPGGPSGGPPSPGLPGGEPGGDANAEQGAPTAGVPGAPGGGGSGGTSDDPDGDSTDQDDDWLGGENPGDDEWATSNTLPGGEGSDQTGASDPMGSPAGEAGAETDGPGANGTLDEALDSALEDFDGEILAERESILKRNQRTAGTANGAAGKPGSQGGGTGSGQSAAANGQAPSGSTAGTYVPGTRNAPSTPPASSGGGRVMTDTPDAQDDDVFARQLREAAVNEVDPELKEKLWEEYRRYKGSS